jgi:superfamily I DNA/RNA helicase
LFPSRGDIEEERRLFYVAMTRARELLNISRPMVIGEVWSGKTRPTEASQFIREASADEIGEMSADESEKLIAAIDAEIKARHSA